MGLLEGRVAVITGASKGNYGGELLIVIAIPVVLALWLIAAARIHGWPPTRWPWREWLRWWK